MNNKIKNILIGLLSLGLIIGLMVYAFITSDFSNLDKVNNGMDSKLKAKIAKKRYYSTDVKIQDNGMLDLGDFEINIGNGQKLITNISAKYNESSSWSISSNIEDEIKSKSSILRHSVIDAIMNQKENDVRSYKVKKAIINNMNKSLSTTSVKDIYFNRLIVSD